MDWHGQNKVSNDTEYFQTVKPPFWKLGEAITTSHVTTNRNRKYIPVHNTPRGNWVDRHLNLRARRRAMRREER